MLHQCQLIGFYSEGQSFFLHGHQHNYTETVPIGKANHHLFYLFMRTIKLLDGSLLGQRTYLVEKIVFTA